MDTNKIMAAAGQAAVWHLGQKRKYSDLPYITHPARVAGRVAVLSNANEDMVCAAYLHDVVEDCGINVLDIGRMFGADVGALVLALTSRSKQTGSKENRLKRNEMDHAYLAKVSPEAKKIKMLDRIDNLNDMEGADLGFLRLYADESESLIKVVGDVDADLCQELQAAIFKIRRKLTRG